MGLFTLLEVVQIYVSVELKMINYYIDYPLAVWYAVIKITGQYFSVQLLNQNVMIALGRSEFASTVCQRLTFPVNIPTVVQN